jgi:carbon storage regulator
MERQVRRTIRTPTWRRWIGAGQVFYGRIDAMGMLVLSRKNSETIIIGDPSTPDCIAITIVEVRGDKVRVGIDAPRDIEVHRGEVSRQILTERKQSAHPSVRARIGLTGFEGVAS